MPRLLVVATVASTLNAFLLPFARHFHALGWTVDCLAAGATRSAACREEFDTVWDAVWSRRPLEPNNLLAAPARVRAVVKAGRHDIVHVHTPVAAFATRLALRGMHVSAGSPVRIYTAHGFHFHQGGSPIANASYVALERVAGRWTDYLVVINDEDFAAATRLRLVPPDRLWYMPGIGVPLDAYSPERVPDSAVTAVRAELGLASGAPLFLMVAAFNRGKRHADALRAMVRLCRAAPAAHLAFAGSGPREQACRELAAELGLSGRVHFLGYRNDIPALIRASVATLLPSEREGLPRSIMESLSLETPVIGAATRGTTDLLARGAGLLFQVGDIAGLAGAMAWVIAHPALAAEMGRRGREQMAPRSLPSILSLHEELYEMSLRRAGISQ